MDGTACSSSSDEHDLLRRLRDYQLPSGIIEDILPLIERQE